MNMKQSCKALICAIEGELDGRHCTEEQAAAILDHALPSLTEALVRVEAERDTAIAQMQNIRKERDAINKELGDAGFNLCIAQQQLAEAVGLLRSVSIDLSPDFDETGAKTKLMDDVDAFLARHAQAEQQEAQAAPAVDERAAFENWRNTQADSLRRCGYPDGAQAFLNLGSVQWAGWQARAALDAQPASGEPAAWECVHGGYVSLSYEKEGDPERAVPLFRYAPPAAGTVAAGEPIQVEAVAVTLEGDDGLYLDWVLEGGISALEAPGVVLLVAHGTVTDDQGSGEVYLAPPAAAHGDEAVRKDAERLDFILTKCRKVVVEMLPRGRDVYVEEGVMGDRTYPAIYRDKDWPAGSAEDFAIKREAIDAAMRAQAGEGGEV